LTGRVKSYSVFKGFGFIYNEEDGPDIFLHVRAVADGSTPNAGDNLTFDLEPADTNVKGQMKAVNVRGGTGYPLTDEQKGERKGGGKGKDAGKGGGKDSYGPAYGGMAYGDAWGPYGKGCGKMMADDWYGGGWGKGSEASNAPQAIDPNAPQGQYAATVKSYSVFKGFGFIFSEEGQPDIFLHVRAIVDGSTPAAGDELTFNLEPADTDVPGQMKAVHVRGGTGYPLTAEQKGEQKGKGKGCPGKGNSKGAGFGPAGGKDAYGCGPWGPYGKGCGGWDGCKGWDGGKGWDFGKGFGCGKGWDFGKGGGCGKGGKDWGYGW